MKKQKENKIIVTTTNMDCFVGREESTGDFIVNINNIVVKINHILAKADGNIWIFKLNEYEKYFINKELDLTQYKDIGLEKNIKWEEISSNEIVEIIKKEIDNNLWKSKIIDGIENIIISSIKK